MPNLMAHRVMPAPPYRGVALSGVDEDIAREAAKVQSATLDPRAQAFATLTGTDPSTVRMNQIRIAAVNVRSVMNAWPSSRVNPQTGRVEKLDTYRVGFVLEMGRWASQQLMAVIAQLTNQVRRLGRGGIVDKIINAEIDAVRIQNTRIVPAVRAAQAAQAQGKLGIPIPAFRTDIGKLFTAMLTLMSLSIQAGGLSADGWVSAARGIPGDVARASKFVVDIAADLVAAPVVFLGDLLLKVAIGFGIVYAAYYAYSEYR